MQAVKAPPEVLTVLGVPAPSWPCTALPSGALVRPCTAICKPAVPPSQSALAEVNNTPGDGLVMLMLGSAAIERAQPALHPGLPCASLAHADRKMLPIPPK